MIIMDQKRRGTILNTTNHVSIDAVIKVRRRKTADLCTVLVYRRGVTYVFDKTPGDSTGV